MLQNSAIASLPCPMSAIFTQLDILLYHILRILHSKSTKHFVMQYPLQPRAAFFIRSENGCTNTLYYRNDLHI